MYSIIKYHFCKTYEKDDLSSELKQEGVSHFKTKKAAEGFMKKELKNKDFKESKFKGDAICTWVYFTGKSWIEENTGEKRDEYYEYRMFEI